MGTEEYETGVADVIRMHMEELGFDSDMGRVAYTGSALTPDVDLKYGDISLVEGTVADNKDYVVTYDNNTNVGLATATIEGAGNYTGTINASFQISFL